MLIHEQGQKIEIEARTDFMGLSADKDSCQLIPGFKVQQWQFDEDSLLQGANYVAKTEAGRT